MAAKLTILIGRAFTISGGCSTLGLDAPSNCDASADLEGGKSHQIEWAYLKTGSTSTESNSCDVGCARNCFYTLPGSVAVVYDVLNAVKDGGRCIFAAVPQQIDNLCCTLLMHLIA